jgi:hypothetical protein
MRHHLSIGTISSLNIGSIRRSPVVEVTYPCKRFLPYSILPQKDVLTGKLHQGVGRNGAAVKLRDLAANHNLYHWS